MGEDCLDMYSARPSGADSSIALRSAETKCGPIAARSASSKRDRVKEVGEKPCEIA